MESEIPVSGPVIQAFLLDALKVKLKPSIPMDERIAAQAAVKYIESWKAPTVAVLQADMTGQGGDVA